MKRSPMTALVATISCAALFTGISATAADAKPIKYKVSGGSMYTIEFKVTDGVDQTVRVGTIGRTGRVTAVSDDWGLPSITSADYSEDTGLVYILARALLGGSSDERCTVMTWDPATPSVDPVMLFQLPSTRTSCQSLYVFDERLAIWALDNGSLEVGHHDTYARDSGTYISPTFFGGEFSWPIVGIDVRSDQKMLRVGSDGKYVLAYMETPVQRSIKGLRGYIRDAQFDARDTAWLLGTRTYLDSRLGVLSFKNRRVAWGNLLRDAETREVWFTDSIFFIQNNG
jgi:hypothetical protein